MLQIDQMLFQQGVLSSLEKFRSSADRFWPDVQVLQAAVSPIGTFGRALMKNTENWSDQVSRSGAAVLKGRGRGLAASLPFIGPSVVASIAYIDPGNFATNIEAGSSFGLKLLWVVVLANLMAMLFQSISARVGIATDKSLASLSRDHFSPKLVLFMCGVGEIGAMATDLAEFLGGAIGLSLLLHVSLLNALWLMGLGTYAMLMLAAAASSRNGGVSLRQKASEGLKSKSLLRLERHLPIEALAKFGSLTSEEKNSSNRSHANGSYCMKLIFKVYL